MRALRGAVAAVLAVTGILAVPAAPARAADSHSFVHQGNPILADGSYYSADPAPLVSGDQLYIYTGHDEAGPAANDFVMNEWGALRTGNVASGEWTHFPWSKGSESSSTGGPSASSATWSSGPT